MRPTQVAAFAPADWSALLAAHPAGRAVAAAIGAEPPADWRPTGLNSEATRRIVAGVVEYWRARQDERGAILDPDGGRERQYATPAFAAAAAWLVQSGREDLRAAAEHAYLHARDALLAGRAADGHADFYTDLLLQARTRLRLTGDAAAWRALVPERVYQDTDGWVNWNLLNVAGELRRAALGLVGHREEQSAYLRRSLETQLARLTGLGLYRDLNAPLAYDAFARAWLSGVETSLPMEWRRSLALGEATTLLLLSPSGEWPCGGRSSYHQWNEAEVAVIGAAAARRWRDAGRAEVARVFQRLSRLAIASVARWQRPDGSLAIVKNEAGARRLGYLRYSYDSVYGLLTAALLASAGEQGDDAIGEAPIPSEIGGYVLEVGEGFHKIVAAAGGYYILLDTGGDPHYEATGLVRVQRSGVAGSPLSGAPAASPWYGCAGAAGGALTPGVQWRDGGRWRGLGEFAGGERMSLYPGEPWWSERRGQPRVRAARLGAVETARDRVRFAVAYQLAERDGTRTLRETYAVSAAGVAVESAVEGAADCRVVFPALVSDGRRDLALAIGGETITVAGAHAKLHWTVSEPPGVACGVLPERLASPNGFVQPVAAALPEGTTAVRWHVALEGGA